MRLFKLIVPILISIILIVLDARFSYLDSFKRFTSTLLTPVYFVVDLPGHVVDWVNDQGSDKALLVSENGSTKSNFLSNIGFYNSALDIIKQDLPRWIGSDWVVKMFLKIIISKL